MVRLARQSNRATKYRRELGNCIPGALAALLIALRAESNDHTRPVSPADLTPPLRLVSAGAFMDEGTMSGEIRDSRGRSAFIGFGGALIRKAWAFPEHVFIGAPYLTDSGARVLPLWSQEERRAIDAASGAVASLRSRVLRGEVPWTPGTPKQVGAESFFAEWVSERRKLLAAIRRGEVQIPTTSRAFFQATEPIRLVKASHPPGSDWFEVELVEGNGALLRLKLGVSPSRESADSLLSPRREAFPDGSNIDRCLLTLVSMAIPESARRRGGNGPSIAPGAVGALEELRDILRARKFAILRDDVAR